VNRGRQPFGFVNAFKPPGSTSTRFGAWVRAQLGGAAVGHWGTLDPAACGVLVLAVGDASRLLPYLEPDIKSYVFELRLGAATDTADAGGTVLQRARVDARWSEKLADVVRSLLGPLEQTAPIFSAVKVRGRPLYRHARAGDMHVARPKRQVLIHAMRVIATCGDRARIAVTCSAGTYVRTLCEQIGARLGYPAHLGVLLRTAAGPFRLADSVLPSQIARDARACLLDPRSVLEMRAIALAGDAARRFAHGMTIAVDAAVSDGIAMVVVDGAIAGIANIAAGALHPKRVFAAGVKGASQAEANV
jgi:tRNA pseudouridine55 synthase